MVTIDDNEMLCVSLLVDILQSEHGGVETRLQYRKEVIHQH